MNTALPKDQQAYRSALCDALPVRHRYLAGYHLITEPAMSITVTLKTNNCQSRALFVFGSSIVYVEVYDTVS